MKGNDITRTGANGRRSSCVAHNGILYMSGITTVDLMADAAGQAKNIFDQIDRLLALNHTNKHNILVANVYLKDMKDYGAFNSAWDIWVDDGFEPARCVVGAAHSLEEYRVKISLIAAIPD